MTQPSAAALSDMTPLRGRVALVTGAAQGIGAATARRLATDGAHVAVNDLPGHPHLEALAGDIGGHAVPADLADALAARSMVENVEGTLGPVDVLVANAAAMSMGRFTDQPLDTWWHQVQVNLTGTFRLIQAVLPGMRRRGGGRIIVLCSEWGVTGWPQATGYAASKAGLISLVKTLGRELAPEGILVNGIAPGVTDTPQLEVDAADAGVSIDEARARYADQTPLGRIGHPDEIAATVALLVSPTLTSLVGQILQPNGGTTRCQA
jgi:NAD(P)-dependent dehydrogenase (short-subunit alcohol dehydrogenase family)